MKEVQHTHNAGALFQAFLKRMDEEAKRRALRAPIDVVATDVPDEPER